LCTFVILWCIIFSFLFVTRLNIAMCFIANLEQTLFLVLYSLSVLNFVFYHFSCIDITPIFLLLLVNFWLSIVKGDYFCEINCDEFIILICILLHFSDWILREICFVNSLWSTRALYELRVLCQVAPLLDGNKSQFFQGLQWRRA